MKKLVPLISIVIALVLVQGCSDDKSQGCWHFFLKQEIRASGHTEIVETTKKECGISKKEANKKKQEYEGTTTSTVDGVKVTIKTTCRLKYTEENVVFH